MPTHRLRHHHHQNNFHHHADPQILSPLPPKPNQKLLSLFLKSIIMGLIVSLFLLFLGVAAIAFLHILLLGSFLHRRRHHHRLSNPTSPTSSSGAFSLDELQKYLPSFKYTHRSSVTAKDCSICLDYFKEGEFCRILPACSHVFHASCVDQWLTKVPNCPVCRTQVKLHTALVIKFNRRHNQSKAKSGNRIVSEKWGMMQLR